MNMNGIAVVISEVKLPSIRVILGCRFTTCRLLQYLFPTWDYCVSTEQDGSIQQSEMAFKECCWATDWSPDKNYLWQCSKKYRADVPSWAAPQDGNATLPSRCSGLFVATPRVNGSTCNVVPRESFTSLPSETRGWIGLYSLAHFGKRRQMRQSQPAPRLREGHEVGCSLAN